MGGKKFGGAEWVGISFQCIWPAQSSPLSSDAMHDIAAPGSSVPVVYTLAAFCAAHHIGRTHLYMLDKAGRGPRRMKVGRRVLITAEAASEWRRSMEARATRPQWRSTTP
jgi:hypothetical protein